MNRTHASAKPSSKPIAPAVSDGAKRRSEAHTLQPFDRVVVPPVGLSDDACRTSVELLNRVLADTMTLRDMYKKHHWQVTGPTFIALHQMFDDHHEQQVELMDLAAERVQALGGVAVAMGPHVGELTGIEMPPKDREDVPTQLRRLVAGHRTLLSFARDAAERAAAVGDVGTNDFLAGQVVRTNETQSWFVSQHLVDVPLVD